jgi:translation initiation factor eIF-2B subunit gamma
VQTYDESQDSGIGTCALLRHFSSRITDDFVVLPCDFVPPESLPLSALLNKFRTESVSDGLIATSCWLTRSRSDKDAAFAEEWGSSDVPILWDEKTGTLLQIESHNDLDRNADDLELRMGLLAK